MESHARKLKLSSQQTARLTQKTSTPKPESFEEILSLKSGVDVRSLSADKIIALSRVIGNHTLQRTINTLPQANGVQTHVTPTQTRIQRLIFTDLILPDQMELKQLASKNNWTEANLLELAEWAKNTPQIRSIIPNQTYVQWLDIKDVFKKGDDLPDKVAQIKAALATKKNEIAAATAKRIAEQAEAARVKLFSFESTRAEIIAGVQAGRIALKHISSFKTEPELKVHQADGTGPITREWRAIVDGKEAQWVLHMHYNNVKNDGYDAYHTKNYASRQSKDVKRKVAPIELINLAQIALAVDLACPDLNEPEKKALREKFG